MYVASPELQDQASCNSNVTISTVCFNSTRKSLHWPPRISAQVNRFKILLLCEYLDCPHDDRIGLQPKQQVSDLCCIANINNVRQYSICIGYCIAKSNIDRIDKLFHKKKNYGISFIFQHDWFSIHIQNSKHR